MFHDLSKEVNLSVNEDLDHHAFNVFHDGLEIPEESFVGDLGEREGGNLLVNKLTFSGSNIGHLSTLDKVGPGRMIIV